MVEKKHLIILDSNSVLHRAYHALPVLTTKKGELVNAIYGFLLVLFKAIREFQPDYIVACFDTPKPTFRHKTFKEYKAKRPPTPEDLSSQISRLKEVLKIFSIQAFEKEGFEADDIIGTISRLASQKQIIPEIEAIILSGDLDTLQLVDPKTKVYLLRKGVKDTVLYDENLVKEKYQGLAPEQLIDFKALRGDPSDNIPGASGIGEKTAIHLLKEFGTIENLYKELEKETDKTKKLKPKLRELLRRQKEQVFFSKSLVCLENNVPIDFDLNKCQWGKSDKEKIIKIFRKLEFSTLIKRLPELGKTSKENEFVKQNLRLW